MAISAVQIFIYSDDFITLGQFLKAANLAQSGGEAKIMLSSGGIMVNDNSETRRGRKLRSGDTVRFGHQTWQLQSAAQTV